MKWTKEDRRRIAAAIAQQSINEMRAQQFTLSTAYERFDLISAALTFPDWILEQKKQKFQEWL